MTILPPAASEIYRRWHEGAFYRTAPPPLGYLPANQTWFGVISVNSEGHFRHLCHRRCKSDSKKGFFPFKSTIMCVTCSSFRPLRRLKLQRSISGVLEVE